MKKDSRTDKKEEIFDRKQKSFKNLCKLSQNINRKVAGHFLYDMERAGETRDGEHQPLYMIFFLEKKFKNMNMEEDEGRRK